MIGSLVQNIESDATSIQPAVATIDSNPHKISLASQTERRKGLRFQDEEGSFEESGKTQTISVPQALPDDDPLEESAALTASPSSQENDKSSVELGAPEASNDPFDEQVTPCASNQEGSESHSNSRQKAPDFGDESDIPRSRPGIENSEKQKEIAVEKDLNPFDLEPNAVNAAPETDPDKKLPSLDALDLPGANDAPESIDFDHDPVPKLNSRSLPSEILEEGDLSPRREMPSNNRPKLPVDVDDEFSRNSPERTREMTKRKPGSPPAISADMIGDGVAGDSTQRGLQQPRLTIEKVAQQQAILDQPLVYTIIVRNQGNVAAHHVVIEDRIPKGTELLGTSPRAELVGKTLIWNEPVLRPNEEKKISIKVVPKQEGPIGSVARVHFATEVSAEIHVAAPPQLEFTVDAPGEVRIGQTFDLVFQLKNIGKVDASNISVRDLVPDHLRHETGHDIECPIGKLAPNEVREIILPVTATKTGSGKNRDPDC